MIPKIIHYCWFGRNQIPSGYQHYINSWKRFLPNYEVKEWNEDNYDVNCIPFSKEAYEVKKYAYVSDISAPEADDMVNVGIGFAVEPHHPIIREVMSFYENTHYIFSDGHMEQIPIVPVVTKVLQKHGMPSKIDKPTNIKGITIYPWDYFCPIEFMSNKLEITKNTRTIHHYSATWMSKKDKFMMWKGYFFRTNILGRGIKAAISILKR